MKPPVWYRDNLEMPEEDEKEMVLQLANTLRKILQTTADGDILDDSISVPRGFALKMPDVSGPRFDGLEAETTQDFIFVNNPTFGAATAKDFPGNLKLVAKTTNRAEWAKKALSSVLRTAESALIPVARIRAAPQSARTAERADLDDSLRFSVWTGLAAHRPLGVINRVRRDTYQMSSELRARYNGCPVHVPATADMPT